MVNFLLKKIYLKISMENMVLVMLLLLKIFLLVIKIFQLIKIQMDSNLFNHHE